MKTIAVESNFLSDPECISEDETLKQQTEIQAQESHPLSFRNHIKTVTQRAPQERDGNVREFQKPPLEYY